MSLLDELEEEKDHSAFLEKLLRALHGEGWDTLTISVANEIREKREAEGIDEGWETQTISVANEIREKREAEGIDEGWEHQ